MFANISAAGLVRSVSANLGQHQHQTMSQVEDLVGSGDSFYYSDLRISLANQVGPDMSPQDLQAVSVLDKQLALMAEHKKLMEDIEFLRYQARDEAKRRRRDLSQRMFAAGAIFGT